MKGRVGGMGVRNVDWQGYFLGDTRTVNQKLAHARSIDRSTARREFSDFVAGIPERRNQLAGLLQRNGMASDGTDRGLGLLGEWMSERISNDPERQRSGGRESLVGGVALSQVWTSVAYDVGAFLGETLIERSDGALRWSLFTKRKTDLSFHQPVITRVRHAPLPDRRIDRANPLTLALSFASSAAFGEYRWDQLVRIVAAVTEAL